MTTSETLTSTWGALETEGDTVPGLYERRVFVHSVPGLFAGLVRPAGTLVLTVEISASVGTEGLERETIGYRVTRQYKPAEKRTRVQLELQKLAYRQLFEVVASDIAATALSASSESSAVAAIRLRLDHWQRFMQSAGQGGLSREQQIGLFGELRFLMALLDRGCAPERALNAWKGPDRWNQDFQFGTRAVEVKASCANSSTRVRISNELQLDDEGLSSLYLCHVWLLEREGAGLSLPDLVSEISGTLPDTLNAIFLDLLMRAGFHAVHEPHYRTLRFAERGRTYYGVLGDFPRIARSDLRGGVAEVAYAIDLAGFDQYAKTESEMMTDLLDTNDE